MTVKNVGVDTFFVPLNKLDISDLNVRRTGRLVGIGELADLIAAQGLLQALGVSPKMDGENATGRYAVDFGGRRLAALQLLAERKAIGKAAPIACRLVPEGMALEVSLAENSGRIAMDPADQVEAFAALHAGGRGLKVERIARRFGVAVQTVKQRLRLAAVSPAIMGHLRAGTLTLDQVGAFAVVDDHAAQEQLYKLLPEYNRTPGTIRFHLTQGKVSATDRRAVLIGADAYQAAGGAILRDLFTEDRGGWFSDPLLLDRLVLDRLTQAAEAVRAEGWGWIEVAVTLPQDVHAMQRVPETQVPLIEADQARLLALAARYDDLADAAGHDPTEAHEAELDAVEAEMEAIKERETVILPEDRARSGVYVTLGHDGITQHQGLLRAGSMTQQHDADADAEGEQDEASDAGPEQPIAAPQEAEGPALSAALAGELAAQRTAALQAQVATRPHLALCLLIEALAHRTTQVCHARILPPALGLACPGIEDSDACKHIAQVNYYGWRMPEGLALLPWLMAHDTAALLDMLAPMVAHGVDAGAADWTTQRGAIHPAAQVAQLAELDMRTWWQPTAANYLSRVPKGAIMDAVRDGAGESAAHRIDGMKKGPMAEAAASLLDGKGWLPSILRVPGGEVTAAQHPGDQAQAAE